MNVEAMAAAIPVIATNTGGIPEIVADGESGLLLPPGSLQQGLAEYVSYLLNHEEVRRVMGCAGRELARSRFRWKQTAERWGQLMRGIE